MKDIEDSSVLDLRGQNFIEATDLSTQLAKTSDVLNLLTIVTLDLSFNRLGGLPADVSTATLPALRELRLGSNQLCGTLEGLHRLPALTSLSLENNRLVSCAGLGRLELVKTLRLDGNQIADTRGLAKLISLTSLDLSRNRIRKLQGFSNLVRLEELFLDSNLVTSLDGLAKCTALRELSLTANRIADLGGLAPLTRLDVLRVNDNRVESLDSLPRMPDLTELHVGRNALVSLDGVGDKLTSLETLDAGGNALDDLARCAPALVPVDVLAELTLADNPLCKTFRSTTAYRSAVREALPLLTYLDGFPAAQVETPSGAENGLPTQEPLRGTESSRELPSKWEALDDPFAPSLEEMEAFKRRMGIHPDVDPFGRPSTSGRSSGRAAESSEDGSVRFKSSDSRGGSEDGVQASNSLDSNNERRSSMGEVSEVEEVSTVDVGNGGSRATGKEGSILKFLTGLEASSRHNQEAVEDRKRNEKDGKERGVETEPESAAARERQRRVSRVGGALADMNERLTSYHAHVTSVIGNLRQRLAPTLDAAAAAMLDNGYLVTATRALPSVPQIDLETPPGAGADVTGADEGADVSGKDAGVGGKGAVINRNGADVSRIGADVSRKDADVVRAARDASWQGEEANVRDIGGRKRVAAGDLMDRRARLPEPRDADVTLGKEADSRSFEGERRDRVGRSSGENLRTPADRTTEDDGIYLESKAERRSEGLSGTTGSNGRVDVLPRKTVETPVDLAGRGKDRQVANGTGNGNGGRGTQAGRRSNVDVSKVDKHVTTESLARATRIATRGLVRLRVERSVAERNKLERAALTDREQRERTDGIRRMSAGGVTSQRDALDGVRQQLSNVAAAHRPEPRVVWSEDSVRSDPDEESGSNGLPRQHELKIPDVSTREGTDVSSSRSGPPSDIKQRRVPAVARETDARPATEALELFYKMFPADVSRGSGTDVSTTGGAADDERGTSAEKENVGRQSKGRGRRSLKERNGEHVHSGRSKTVGDRTARTAPAALHPEGSGPKERGYKAGQAKRTSALPIDSKGRGVPITCAHAGGDRALKLPLIPTRVGNQIQNRS